MEEENKIMVETNLELICEKHRLKNGLVATDILDIDCEYECKIIDNCPLIWT